MKSLKRNVIFLLISGAILLILPASADLTTITAGGTVFIGEQGLDITSCVPSGSYIGWWGSGASLSADPTYQVLVSDNTSFFVDPGTFGSRTGPWYRVSDKASAFNVVDPTLSLKVYDITVDSDRTGTWIPWGDQIQFRIQGNLYSMTSRGGGGAPVTIKIQTPTGSVLTSVIGPGGSTYSLDPVYVTSDPFTPSAIWDTGNSAYSAGSYQIWAECNANHMKDNYNVVGKTTTQGQASVGVQDVNPAIQKGSATTATPTLTTLITTAIPTTIATTKSPIPEITTLQPSVEPSTSEATSLPTTSETIVANTTTPTKKSSGFESIAAIGAIVGLIGISMCLQIRSWRD
ncbi:MAG: DUF3821 domain-containing protein [Methanoregulaceae archaeon]